MLFFKKIRNKTLGLKRKNLIWDVIFILFIITVFSIGTFYPFKVKASAPQGLIGVYHAPYYKSGKSVSPIPFRGKWIDEEINFDNFHDILFERLGEKFYVEVLWHGLIYIDHSEVYTFYTDTESENFLIWIDRGNADYETGRRVIGSDKINWTCGGDCEGSMFLTEGWHTIHITYRQGGGGAIAKLYYESPSTPKQIIPKTHLLALAEADDNIYIPAKDQDPQKISATIGGVGMSLQEDGHCFPFKNINNQLKVTVPDNVQKNDVWLNWNGKHGTNFDSTISINGIEIVGTPVTYYGSRARSGIYKYNVPVSWVPDGGQEWILNIGDMDFYSPVWGVHLLKIRGREKETKLDKLLITNDQSYVPTNKGGQGGYGTDKVWLEAETQVFRTPMEIVFDSGASGGEYMQSTQDSEQAHIKIHFHILPQPDPESNYVIWARVKTLSDVNNSFYIEMDNDNFGEWHIPVTGDNWEWHKMPFEFENKCCESKDCTTYSDKKCLRPECLSDGRYQINNGLQVIIPYLDESQLERRLQIKLWGEKYLGISSLMTFEFTSLEDPVTIDPMFVFSNGETRYKPNWPRPSYLYWAHGSGEPLGPDAQNKLPEFTPIVETEFIEKEGYFSVKQYIDLDPATEELGKLLVPTAPEIFETHSYVPGFEQNPPSSWFPGFSREGAQFDVISSNYQPNQALLNDHMRSFENGDISPLTLDPGDTWIAFQLFKFLGKVGGNKQVGSPESIYWSGGAALGAIVPKNNPPSATNLAEMEGNYCFSPYPPIILSWQFIDPDLDDYQTAYQVQIDNNSSFSSPEDDTGKIYSSSAAYAPIGLSHNTTYYWRLKVWDSSDESSQWVVGPSFITAAHAYPWPDFTWIPKYPFVDEQIQFIDQTTYETSGTNWKWFFGDGESSFSQNPTHSYSKTGTYTVRLEACDDSGCCPVEKKVNISFTSPEWKEIVPY
jgi:hypothetical protein